MPGVLQLEAIAQVAGIAMFKTAENIGKIAYFMSAEDVKWRKPVYPGDVLVIEVELTKIRGKIGKAKGMCKVRGEVVSEAAVTFMLMELTASLGRAMVHPTAIIHPQARIGADCEIGPYCVIGEHVELGRAAGCIPMWRSTDIRGLGRRTRSSLSQASASGPKT